ncbi:MAG: glycoside hydrolase family 25 protein [Terrimonas sp.]|nr:glycoside hydrolase family 25 protein [Terrimonas sp.]
MAVKKRRKRKKKTAWIWVLGLIVILFFIYLWGFDWWISRKARFVSYPEFGIAIPEKYAIHGIDVSKYQEVIAWEAVKAMQVKQIKMSFVFIKATEGIGNTDRHFRRNWRKSKQAGLTRGAYHFFLATKDGRMQAENFISKVDLEPGDLPPVLDIEQTYGVSPEALKREVKEWLAVVEASYGIKPIIYTNVDFYKRKLGSEFDSYPLWIAHYLQPEKPRIDRDWSFWQHSETGHVNGILSKVDFNVFNGDSAAFSNLLYK